MFNIIVNYFQIVLTVVVVVEFKGSRGLKYEHIPRLCPSTGVTARQAEEYCIFYF